MYNCHTRYYEVGVGITDEMKNNMLVIWYCVQVKIKMV